MATPFIQYLIQNLCSQLLLNLLLLICPRSNLSVKILSALPSEYIQKILSYSQYHCFYLRPLCFYVLPILCNNLLLLPLLHFPSLSFYTCHRSQRIHVKLVIKKRKTLCKSLEWLPNSLKEPKMLGWPIASTFCASHILPDLISSHSPPGAF